MDRSPSVSVTPARIALAVPALILLTVIGWLNYHSRQKLLEITRDGVETHGEIVGKYCSNHGVMSYSFMVNEKKFYGSGLLPRRLRQGGYWLANIGNLRKAQPDEFTVRYC